MLSNLALNVGKKCIYWMVCYNKLLCLISLFFFSREMCIRFADLERKLGEIDRARAVYMHASQMADPRVCLSLTFFTHFLNKWELTQTMRITVPMIHVHVPIFVLSRCERDSTSLLYLDFPQLSLVFSIAILSKDWYKAALGQVTHMTRQVFPFKIPANKVSLLSFSDHSDILERVAWLWSSAWKRGYIPRNVAH